MSFSRKAIFAALLLSLSPTLAPAQSFNAGGANPLAMPSFLSASERLQHDLNSRCGADELQGFVGHPASAMQPYVTHARYVAPGGNRGATGVALPHLTVDLDADDLITRVYCY